jgi:hypothetical protein
VSTAFQWVTGVHVSAFHGLSLKRRLSLSLYYEL